MAVISATWRSFTRGEWLFLGPGNYNKPINCDHGIVAQSILLGAVERGFVGCMIRNIKRDALRKALSIIE